MPRRILLLAIFAGAVHAQAPQTKPLYVLEDSYINWRLLPSEQSYASIDGKHLKQYVVDQANISLHYRDNGHPQFWGRISGTEADADNARWLEEKFRSIGLSEVHQQSFDLPEQWMPQSWTVSASAGGTTLDLQTAQPTYRTQATPAEGLELEAVDAGLATDAELDARDLKGKAVFFYTTDYFSRHATISNRAWKRIADRGAAAIFSILAVPGNIRTQFYPVGVSIPTFSLGLQDGVAARAMIDHAGATPARVKIRLAVNMVPNLKTSTVWGTLPGATDETVVIVAHRDAWFQGANDNGTGVATMIGLAEYFAKIPQSQRRRTIIFAGTSGHHDGSALSGKWFAEHKEFFSKTALLINCEHTADEELVLSNGVIRKTNGTSPQTWYVGGSHKLEQIVVNAFQEFGVATYAEPERAAAGEMGRYQNLAPSMQVIDTGYYWHSDFETPEIIPPTALAAITRAYAKIITDVNALNLEDVQRPPTSSGGANN